MALLGLIGGPLTIASGIAELSMSSSKVVPGCRLRLSPEFLWELSLGIYLTV